MTEPTDSKSVTTLRDLPLAIEPPRDLWPQIEARLGAQRDAGATPAGAAGAARRAARVPLRWLATAAMVASLAVGVWIGRSVAPGAVPPVAGDTRPASAMIATAWESDPRYQRQHEALMQSLGAQLATLPPASRSKVLSSLATIHEAKRQLQDALGKDPGNALLQELLVNTYQDEMRVLTDVHEASDAGRGI
ncbi:MAG: anti-sigma factor [Steroidobacteraceae bacterium]